MFDKWWQVTLWFMFIIAMSSLSNLGVTYILERRTTAGQISRAVYKAIDNEIDSKVIKGNGYTITIKRDENYEQAIK